MDAPHAFALAVGATHFPELGSKYVGKVRDTYACGDRLVLITTDRISAFDHVLRQTIPFKGQILNRLAAYFFSRTADVVPNHLVDLPHGNVAIGVRCTPFPVEFVVRGYLAGHAWRTYAKGERSLCGASLPDGLTQNARLPSPILTPTTKASEGHDEDISPDAIVARGILDADTLHALTEMALRLFARGSEMARERGLLLVDTKYEFGRTPDGRLVVIDEIHTPDSSRYFYAEGYEERLAQGQPQRQLSKEFVREWLMANGFQGLEGQTLPDLDDAFRLEVTARYAEVFELLTGTAFEPDLRPLDAEFVRNHLPACS